MPRQSPADRRERILDAAEEAFAELGFAGASLRHIVQAARVNLATVYYYYGSKEALMEAVLDRRFGPLRREHLERLAGHQRAAGGRVLPVEQILEAMLLPPLRLAMAPPAHRQAVTRLIGRIATEPNPRTQEMLRCRHSEVRSAFLKALRASLPHVPEADLRWRLEFVWGALAFILCNPHRLEKETHGVCDPVDAEKVMAEMIEFFSPGFRASKDGGQSPKSAGRIARRTRRPHAGAPHTSENDSKPGHNSAAPAPR